VSRIALLVASHGDADHLGGVPALLRAFPADVVVEPGQGDGRPLYREFLAGVVRRAARWHAARAGDVFTLDGVTLRAWHPDSAWLERRAPANENSVVLTVEYGAFRAAFPGDAGLPMEDRRAAAVGRVTLLKVGHHGSRTATGDAWLGALRPALCVISVGRNDYGHPDAGVLAALERDGCAVWRTDRDGMVTVDTDGADVRLDANRGRDTALAARR
jgi:competence protein ComEC